MSARDTIYAKRRKIRESRLLLVAELYRKGKSYRQIQQEVMRRLEFETYSLQTVSRDVETLLKEWQKTRITDMELAVQAELEKISASESELWDAWEKSKKDYKATSQKQKGELIGGTGSKKGKSIGFKGSNSSDEETEEKPGIRTTRMEKTEQERIMFGDARYQEAIAHCRDQRIKLLGLNAPSKIAQTDSEGNDVNFASFLMQVNVIDGTDNK